MKTGRTFVATAGEETFRIDERDAAAHGEGGRAIRALPSIPGTHLVEIARNGRSDIVYARALRDGTWEVWIGGNSVSVSILDERHAELAGHARRAGDASPGKSVRAPMPGLIKEISVAAGQTVRRGQRLLTLEAMKMENEIAAPIDGIVDRCALTPGTSVEKDQELLHITRHP